jgi:hypothetical protein
VVGVVVVSVGVALVGEVVVGVVLALEAGVVPV